MGSGHFGSRVGFQVLDSIYYRSLIDQSVVTPIMPPCPLITCAELHKVISAGQTPHIFEVSWLPNQVDAKVFETGHIPGALQLDVQRDLCAPLGEAKLPYTRETEAVRLATVLGRFG